LAHEIRDMKKLLLTLTAVLGALAVAIGAFGAHSLESTLEANGYVDTYETAVKYHFYHVLAALIVLIGLPESKWKLRSCLLFLVGILLFSGSLYTLSITGVKWLGAITPLGGASFILGWLMLIPAFRKI